MGYSLAILIAEALGDRRDDFNVRIFATDLDDEAIAFARTGIYSAAALSVVPGTSSTSTRTYRSARSSM